MKMQKWYMWHPVDKRPNAVPNGCEEFNDNIGDWVREHWSSPSKWAARLRRWPVDGKPVRIDENHIQMPDLRVFTMVERDAFLFDWLADTGTSVRAYHQETNDKYEALYYEDEWYADLNGDDE